MIVLGIDPGTAVTGYGVLRTERPGMPALVECGVVRTRPRDPLPARLAEIFAGIQELVARHRPAVLALEDVFYSKNVRTTVVLGHARGVIMLAAQLAAIPVHEYPPAEIKKAVAGTGAATKEQVQFMLTRLLRLKSVPTPSDAADGVACALTYALGARVPTFASAAELRARAARGLPRPTAPLVISQISGTLALKDLDRVEILTPGGVGYELLIPLGVFESLPKLGEPVQLHTHLVVKEDGWQLYGFGSPYERRVFQRVLAAKGVGPALALGLLSTLTAERLVRAIRERDIPTLQGVPRVGRKKAEQLILDLADKLDELQGGGGGGGPRPEGAGAEDAIRALVSLGYTSVDAEKAVRKAIDDGGRGLAAPELIRRALAGIRG